MIKIKIIISLILAVISISKQCTKRQEKGDENIQNYYWQKTSCINCCFGQISDTFKKAKEASEKNIIALPKKNFFFTR